MALHSSTLAWKISWTEEPGRLQSLGLRRVGHNWATSLSLLTFMLWRRKWQPTPVFLPGESIPGTGKPGGLSSMGSHRVGHDWSDLAATTAAAGVDASKIASLGCLNWTERYCSETLGAQPCFLSVNEVVSSEVEFSSGNGRAQAYNSSLKWLCVFQKRYKSMMLD